VVEGKEKEETMKKLVYMSSTLSNMLAKMSPAGQDEVAAAFQFYSEEYERAKRDNPGNEISVAAAFQDKVQQKMDELAKNTDHKINCGKGCSFCCFQHVAITDDEAQLMLEYAKEKNVEIDYERLERQQKAKSDVEFKALPVKDRRCVFLNSFASCSIYDHRPMACRKVLVVSDPLDCDTENRPGAQVGQLVDVEAEVMASAAMDVTESGGMADVLLKLNEKKG
jgi:Fe-S-cluster containining protein